MSTGGEYVVDALGSACFANRYPSKWQWSMSFDSIVNGGLLSSWLEDGVVDEVDVDPSALVKERPEVDEVDVDPDTLDKEELLEEWSLC
ncbi:hypothetical protein DFA_10585 [Cavenderia fasciculata]|uniref:Uncharacterized protein n=1 Tax=Cavenderia fasciculata TaxID=261658 RepID=F4QAM3_CACFS|nr:uncharacterized protein DFA_10585 [Cavenderia fasciculata]EGG15742.1 hypothetical protein DFA_10585 [Cavenderia fasciculata]|eukprot:XP_004354489.1 hypothetical protein DFA_10585 [Cavenderia fasciculata]